MCWCSGPLVPRALRLAFAPFLWTGLELAAARITSVPWDQLGYSQVDNALINQLAPWTGVYGITFVLVAVNALLAGGLLLRCTAKSAFVRPLGLGSVRRGSARRRLSRRLCSASAKPDPTATAVLIQPNLDVGEDNNWQGAEWDRHIAQFARLAGEECKNYIAGIPQTGAPSETNRLSAVPHSSRPRCLAGIARSLRRVGSAISEGDGRHRACCSTRPSWWAALAGPTTPPTKAVELLQLGDHRREPTGRSSAATTKFISFPSASTSPFQNLLKFAHKLTGRVSKFSRGTVHKVFLLDTQTGGRHRYGIFHLL